MRTTKHGGTQSPGKYRDAVGIPLALLAVGVVICLAAALLNQGGAAPRSAVTAAESSVQPAAPDVTADATTKATQPPLKSPPPARRTPKATSKPTPTRTASTTKLTPRATPSTQRTTSAGSLAGRIKPGIRYRGVATAYEAADGNGACLFGPADDLMIAAMNHTDYESAKACGAHVLVRAANGASITVLITNECPLPCAPGQIDLSQQAFAKLAKLSVGRLPITWTLQSPGSSGTISIRYKVGSSQWWCGIQAIGHRNPLATLEVRTAKGWRKLHRTDYNYFLSPDGSGCGKAIRITDIYGQRLTIDGLAVKPDVVQSTRVQFARH
ncbi:expansin EXLX1 family cellulose-binding protein [Kribbella sp. NPDC005582]|uniref:expansin EXLX1 family cellulose-binding protein n=1 Tax=Kribbella sp. NPDC005582 TaxID=3156893 RepID=UPI0033ABEBCF